MACARGHSRRARCRSRARRASRRGAPSASASADRKATSTPSGRPPLRGAGRASNRRHSRTLTNARAPRRSLATTASRTRRGELQPDRAPPGLKQALFIELPARGAADLAARRLQAPCVRGASSTSSGGPFRWTDASADDLIAQRGARRWIRSGWFPPRRSLARFRLLDLSCRTRPRSPCVYPGYRRSRPRGRRDGCCGRRA